MINLVCIVYALEMFHIFETCVFSAIVEVILDMLQITNDPCFSLFKSAL